MQFIENLYNKATSAVYLNGGIGDWFRTTVGVRQCCLLSPTLFNIFLERSITDAVEDHQWTVRIGGRTITNLRCWRHWWPGGKEEELASLVDRLDKTSAFVGIKKKDQRRPNWWPITRMISALTSKWTLKIGRGWQLQGSGRSRHWSVFQVWNTVQNCTDNSSTSETEDHLER